MAVSPERNLYIRTTLESERVLALAAGTGDLSKDLPALAETLCEAGIHILEITCRAPAWLNHLEVLTAFREKRNPKLIVAVGTQTDIFSVHKALENGADIIVAAHSLQPYAGLWSIPEERRKFIAEVKDPGGIDGEPCLMDPIRYVKMRGGVVIPASDGLDGLKGLKMRGADYQKLYPAQAKAPAEWTEIFKATSAADGLKIVPSGGVNEENAAAYLKIPHVAAVSASFLTQGSLQEIRRKAAQFVETVNRGVIE